jgi:lipoyl(octanoyl) transferase
MKIIDADLKPYAEILNLQLRYFEQNVAEKIAGRNGINVLILCQHTPVFTLGRNGKKENILVSEDDLKAEFYQTNRGGDVTFHGPGQLVAYPILDLDLLHIGLAAYIEGLEEVIIETLSVYGLTAHRIGGAAGVWISDSKGERKICAIGVKASRNITMHGLAMNINTDLSYFDKIVPCGLTGKTVTSLEQELGVKQDFEIYKQVFIGKFGIIFGL